MREGGASDESRIAQLYRIALARAPRPGETARGVAFVRMEAAPQVGERPAAAARTDAESEARWTSLCQALFASAEFRYVR